MITDADKKTIKSIASRYAVKRVFLFGSSVSSVKKSRDIDIAVEGILAKDFYSFYGDLMFGLKKPIDVIDLSEPSKFAQLIKREGVLLYG